MAIGDRIPFGSQAANSLVNTATNTSTNTRLQTTFPPESLPTDPKDLITKFDADKLYANGLIAGDIKDSIRATDHNGWVLLDGRAKSSLTPTQQSAATSLGIGANLPDSRNRLAMGASSTRPVGSVGGDNTIARNNLPNVNITSTSNGGQSNIPTSSVSAGTPSGTVAVRTFGEHDWAFAHNGSSGTPVRAYGFDSIAGSSRRAVIIDSSGDSGSVKGTNMNHGHDFNGVALPNHNHTVSTSDHTHNVSLNGGVTQVDFVPEFIALNKFIYLGE